MATTDSVIIQTVIKMADTGSPMSASFLLNVTSSDKFIDGFNCLVFAKPTSVSPSIDIATYRWSVLAHYHIEDFCSG